MSDMDGQSAVDALSALAQESRLAAFRALVRAGAPGLPAGTIARTLGVPHNTLSTHLSILCRAGLLRARRDGRSMIYAVDFEGTRALLAFLLEDCCQGSPALCCPLLDALMPAECCDPSH